MSQSYGNGPPIPTYEEAVGTEEIQGLLSSRRHASRHPSGFQPPTADSPRNSQDSNFTEPELDDENDRELRRDIEQMELEEPTDRHRSSLQFPKFTYLREHLSGISLPQIPSFLTFFKPSWILLIRFVALVLVVGLVYGLVVMRVLTWRYGGPGGQFLPESVRQHIQFAVDAESIKGYLKEIAFDDHVAGTKGDFFLAEWVEELYKEAGLDGVWFDNYEVYLNYPRADGRRVAIIDPPDKRWEAILEEHVEPQDPPRHPTLAFHGHSRSGNVTGPLIYANYGAREDFEYLKSQNVNLTGSIVLVKYYGSQGDRALKVKAAELAGAAGCLIYSDPADDGFLKGPAGPSGPWRRFDSLQRGAVSLMSWVVGDVLTPGVASTHDAERLSTNNNPGLVNIPSLPLAWRDAAPLITSLHNHGIAVPENWRGGVPDVGEWWSGDAGSSPIVHLMNLQDEVEKQPIRNVIGRIQGYESPEKVIYAGNHRDAWCFGAVDPGSGTAVMLEVVRVFGTLLQRGWRPRRTIVFASWDAEEYNLIGSTEHVEEGIEVLRKNAVAYLNVDSAVSGNTFSAAGNPLFERVLTTVLGRVEMPEGNETALEHWQKNGAKLGGLGAGSDYVAFQGNCISTATNHNMLTLLPDLAGTASLDFEFSGPGGGYPYHSCQESIQWLENFVDPSYYYHATMAEIWALLILELSDEHIVPLDFAAYSRELTAYVAQLKSDAQAFAKPGDEVLDVSALEKAAAGFITNAEKFMSWEENW
jgi:N-acetylated-alpha-linked acidic dipeptidase